MQTASIEELLGNLPDTLDYVGEFGTEVICFLPTIYWLHLSGLLGNRKVLLYHGMQSFYYFLPREQILTKREPRGFAFTGQRPAYLANRHEYFATPKPTAMFPDYRKHFSKCYPLHFDKPVCVIHNKYCDEWGDGPVNYLSLEFLDTAFSRLKQKFQIIYFREGVREVADGFCTDDNPVWPFADHEVLARHPEVVVFEDLLDCHPALDYNTLKNVVFSKTHFFLSSQGGGTYHCALFSGSLLAILHKQGDELGFAYSEGLFRFSSNPAPVLLICSSDQQLERSVDVVLNSEVAGGCVLISPSFAGVVEELKPPPVPDVDARLAELEKRWP